MTAMTTAGPQTRAVQLVEPMPGFADDAFALAPIDEHGVLWSMRSVQRPDLRFVLTEAGTFFDDYRPVLGAEVADALGADTDEHLQVLLVLSIPTGLADATANTRAPIVVEPGSGRALQVVLEDETLSMRRPLLAHTG